VEAGVKSGFVDMGLGRWIRGWGGGCVKAWVLVYARALHVHVGRRPFADRTSTSEHSRREIEGAAREGSSAVNGSNGRKEPETLGGCTSKRGVACHCPSCQVCVCVCLCHWERGIACVCVCVHV